MFIGCGALNWDIFFRVEKIEDIRVCEFKLKPGEEYVLERDLFLEFYENLKKVGYLVFQGGGGSSANTIYALAKFGFETSFLGAVGEDEFGERVLQELSEASVETKFIRKGGTTSLALILLDKNNDRTIIVSPGTAENYLIFEEKNIPVGTIYHLTSFASKIGQNFQINLLNALSTKISFDPGEIYSRLGKNFLTPFIKKTKFLFLTERELELSGLAEDELLEMGVLALFIKKGREGAEVITKKKRVKSSVCKAPQIIDNTGAGDFFNAGVLAGLFLKLEIDMALSLGLGVASLSLRDYGRRGLPDRKEFKKFLSRLK
ncbi:MAG: carbohydrate kinase family protein [Caldimicrobium sp.]